MKLPAWKQTKKNIWKYVQWKWYNVIVNFPLFQLHYYYYYTSVDTVVVACVLFAIYADSAYTIWINVYFHLWRILFAAIKSVLFQANLCVISSYTSEVLQCRFKYTYYNKYPSKQPQLNSKKNKGNKKNFKLKEFFYSFQLGFVLTIFHSPYFITIFSLFPTISFSRLE